MSVVPAAPSSTGVRVSVREAVVIGVASFLGGGALAYALAKRLLTKRDAPLGAANIDDHFRGLVEAHIRKRQAKAAASGAAAAAEEDDVIIRAPTAEDTEAVALQTHDSFNNWNKSVGLPPEFPTMDLTRWVIGDCIANDLALIAVSKSTGEVLGSVFNYEVDIEGGAVSCGPWSAKWGSLQQGTGRKLVESIVATSIRHGAKSIRLIQIQANLTSLSLYTSLGFVIREPLTVWAGMLRKDALDAAIAEGVALDYTVRPMLESDVPACDALHRDALGITRKNTLINDVREDTRAKIVVLDRKGNIMSDEAKLARVQRHGGWRHSCIGSRSLSPLSVPLLPSGYNTGMSVVSHTLVTSPLVFRFVIAHAQLLHRARQPETVFPTLHTCTRLYPELDRWLLNSGARVHRTVNLMCLGEWQPIKHDKYVYGSTICY